MFQSKLNKVTLRRRDTLEAYRSVCVDRCVFLARNICEDRHTTDYSFVTREFECAQEEIAG